MAVKNPRMEILPQLPDELTEEVFVRLPTKAITRCKILKNGWYGKISGKNIIRRHGKEISLQNRVRTLLQPEHCYLPLQYFITFGGQMMNRRVLYQGMRASEYIAHCGPLALVANLDDEIFFLNPTTKKQIPVPDEVITFPPRMNTASVVFGLGYNLRQEDYQVVRLTQFNFTSWRTEIKVFSKSTNAWSDLGAFPHSRIVTTPGVYACFCIHWLMYSDNIVAFNLVDESYRLICLPSGINRDIRHISFTALNGEKLLIIPTFYTAPLPVDLWILEDYTDDKTWIKHSVNLDVPIRNLFSVVNFQALYLVEPKREKIVFRINPFSTFCCWDLKEMRFYAMPGEQIVNVASNPFPYVEALS